MRKLIVVLLACCVVTVGAAAQEKKAGKSYVLKAARMFDGKSNAVTSPGMVVVTDGQIVGVGTSATTPAGAEVIDLGDATLAGRNRVARSSVAARLRSSQRCHWMPARRFPRQS